MHQIRVTKSKIDIIVPVYNAASYIERCILSILNQSYQDFRLILVDDGSQDESLHICQHFAGIDDRITIIHQSNKGVSEARNTGLSIIEGDWVMFVDSDDYLSESALEVFTNSTNEDVDLVISSFVCEYNVGKRIVNFGSGKIKRASFYKLFSEAGLASKTSIWGKFFRQSLIKKSNLRFDSKMKHAEDLVFLFQYLAECQAIAMTENVCYHYVFDNTQSLSRRVNDFETESWGRSQVIKASENLRSALKIEDASALSNLQWPVDNATYRTLQALYHSSLPRDERLKVLYFLNLKRKYNRTGDKKLDFLNVLLGKGLFRTYDFIRSTKSNINYLTKHVFLQD